MINKYIYFIVIFMPCFLLIKPDVQIICFSYKRPLQLYAFLESSSKFLSTPSSITVLYRTDNDRGYENGYNSLAELFPAIDFIKQKIELGKNNFKEQLVELLKKNKSDYIMFAVDDIIVTSYIDLSLCESMLKQENAYSFHLRLGKNIDFSYQSLTENNSLFKYEKKPNLTYISDTIYSWRMDYSYPSDWNYPNNVDMTIYKKSDIQKIYTQAEYYNPNSFESIWSGYRPQNNLNLCFENSKIINIPLTLVHTQGQTQHLGYSLDSFLELFNKNMKISIEPITKNTFNAAHAEIMPLIISR